ncbi:hypothetical protein [Mycobacterium sp. AZCC_0083]|uniref:hypothetical protein n=1 Tax=Mycobacterium sp. AZCC_0083 TaxID=2735882 RepID=UPI001617B15C|nr:hypothetical protein [Mycobacterium sp. AZCC_0083]MBB5167132.1 hypothetical protein [Mycobacterium sp. AZCC_0083]
MYQEGKFLLIKGDRVLGTYNVLAAAKGVRTKLFRGAGDIYRVVVWQDGWEPTLELVDEGA